VLAMLDVEDPARMDETMRKIEEFLDRNGLATAEDSDTAGIRRWSIPDGPAEAVAWTIDGDELAIGYPEAAVEEFAAGVPGSLADSDDWKRTMELMPNDKTSIFFVSLARVVEEVRKSEGAEEEFAALTDNRLTLDDLAPIRSAAMASSQIDGGYGFRIAVLIKD